VFFCVSHNRDIRAAICLLGIGFYTTAYDWISSMRRNFNNKGEIIMDRWTIKQLNETSDLRFAMAILNERVNKLTQPYSPLASKLRSAVAKLEELADAEETQAEPEREPKQYMSYEEVFEDLGWRCIKDEDGTLELNQTSPTGEDFWFSIDGVDIPVEVAEYADDFDVNEHVGMYVETRGMQGVPRSIRTLVEDAEAIQKMLDELAEALVTVQTNCDLGIYDCSTCAIHGKCAREEEGLESIPSGEEDDDNE